MSCNSILFDFVDADKVDQPGGGHKRNSGDGNVCHDVGPVPKAARASAGGELDARNVAQGPDGPVGVAPALGEMDQSGPLFQAFLGFMNAFRGYRGGGGDRGGTWSRRRGGRRPSGGPGGRGGRRAPGGGRPWQRGPRRSWW